MSDAPRNARPASKLPWTKILKIKEFGGEERSAEALQDWLESIETYTHIFEADDNERVPLAITKLVGAAKAWWRSIPESQRPTTWDQFVIRIKGQFFPANYEQASRDRLRACKQTKSVSEYIDRFRKIVALIPDLSSGDAIDRFVDGLKVKVKQQARLHSFSSLEEAYEFADRVDRSLFNQSFAYSWRANSTSAPSSSSSFPVPMEIGNIALPTEGVENDDDDDEDVVEMKEAKEVYLQALAKVQNRHPKYHAKAQAPKRDFKRPAVAPHQGKKMLVCWTCGGVGHPARVCPSTPNEDFGVVRGKSNGPSGNGSA